MVHNWVSRVYLPNSVIRASSRTALWKRSSHSTLDRTNSASSSSARISSKRRMAADWGVKSGIKTRRSTSGRVRYRRRMKPSSVAGIAPKHSRISSGLRPRRRALESAIGIRRFAQMSSPPFQALRRRRPPLRCEGKRPSTDRANYRTLRPQRAGADAEQTHEEESSGLVHAPPLQFVTGRHPLDNETVLPARLATVPYCGTDEPDPEIVRRAVFGRPRDSTMNGHGGKRSGRWPPQGSGQPCK